MVKSVFRFLNRETSALHSAAYLLAFFALSSQVLAFVRDRLLAHTFGASTALDSYYAAFRIPDFLFVTVASVVSLSALVPFIVERERQGKEEVRKFVDDVFSFFSILIIGVSIVAFFLIPALSGVLFKGFSGEELAKVVLMSRVFLISPVFLGFSNLFGALTQSYNRFTAYAAAPLVYNLGIIFGILFLAPRFGALGVAYGVVLGSLLHCCLQIPFVWKLGLSPRPKLVPDMRSIKDVAVLSFPRTLSLSVNHVAQLFLISLASLMTVGSISIYSFALNIQSVPLSIIGVSYSLAAFPTLTRHFAEKNMGRFVSYMADTARHIVFWSLPATALFIVLRTQVIRVLLGSGRFSIADTRLTAAALALFSVSALSQCLLLLFTRAFYSAGHTKKPFLINLISGIGTVLMAYLLTKYFYASAGFRSLVGHSLGVSDLPGLSVLMLPLGYTIGTIVNGIVHWVGFEKDFARKDGAESFSALVLPSFFESLAAALALAAATQGTLMLFAPVFSRDTTADAFFHGFIAGVIGIAVGLAVLFMLGNKELKENWNGLHRRFWKSKVVATDKEIV